MTKDPPPPPLVREAEFCYIVAVALGLGAIGGVSWTKVALGGGSAVEIPETLSALGAATNGALAGLLAAPGRGRG